MASSEKWVGQGIERFEDEALLSGRARFIDNLEPVPGLCHAAILRSPYGSADTIGAGPITTLKANGQEPFEWLQGCRCREKNLIGRTRNDLAGVILSNKDYFLVALGNRFSQR